MLTVIIGKDWTVNRDEILRLIAQDVAQKLPGRILMVPELVSHDTERRLAAAAGNTASRYAEVLSFTRLVRRVAEAENRALEACLDNGGRVAAMAAAVRQLHSKLKSYAAVETKPEFLQELVDAVDEMKRCCISAEDLMNASRQTEGSLSQKLEELSLLLDAYDALCAQGKRDPRDQMFWLLDVLADGEFAQTHVFYVDGFPDFTRQNMAVLEHLIRYCPHVTVALNCDRVGSENMGFEKAGQTAQELVRFAKASNIEYEIRTLSPRNDALTPLRDQLYQGKITMPCQDVQVIRCDSPYQECETAAMEVMRLVRAGFRYRDISIVCTDPAAYADPLGMIFRRCGLPLYLSGTEDVLQKSVMVTVLSALDAVIDGFEQRSVMRYMKSVLSPLDEFACDTLENYVITWAIDGKRWLEDWTMHPDGLSGQWDADSQSRLQALNNSRQVIIVPLQKLKRHFDEAKNMADQIEGLYSFLEEIQLALRLEELADTLDALGDNRNAQILNQLWDILLDALEQMYDTLGATVWNPEIFTRLLTLLLRQYDVGTIPTVLDAVTAGPVTAMRCQQPKHLILLGANEGNLPCYGGSKGLLTDQERVTLRQLGMTLTGGAMEGLQAEFAEIYGVFCGAQTSVTVTYSSSQPSFVCRRLIQLAGGEKQLDSSVCIAMGSSQEAGSFLARWDALREAEQINAEKDYQNIRGRAAYELGTVQPEQIRALYGKKLKLSASQIDRQAECRLSYFLRYGLRAKEIKEAAVDPAEFGTFVHAVLEDTVREVMRLGGFHRIDAQKCADIALDYARKYATAHFSQVDSARMQYQFRRNFQELDMIVKELWSELSVSGFVPVDVETDFGDGCKLPAIAIDAHSMEAVLRGFVDRVDAWKEDGRNYFRVVDYKTGKKDFDYCDVFNGIGLQMLLYLFALESGGEKILGQHPYGAGVQYFPARSPLMNTDSRLTEEEADREREKLWKRKGLLLRDEDVIHAMDPDEKLKRLDCDIKNDGTITGYVADRDQLRQLRQYVFRTLGKIVDEIASGNVQPNPYTRGTSHDACTYCPYGSVCHKTEVPGRRNYKTMSAERFWEEIGKELNRNG